MGGKEVDKSSALPQWILDYQLVEWGQQGLFYEYLEMGKFSFAHYAFMANIFGTTTRLNKKAAHLKDKMSYSIKNDLSKF